jgi:predicted DNA-binding transcriptional regulator YafY
VLRGEGGTVENVVLRFTPQAAAWVRDERWHHSQQMEALADGGLVLRFHCSINHELVRWLLSFGAGVRVELPDHLRNTLVDEAKEILSGERTSDRGANWLRR